MIAALPATHPREGFGVVLPSCKPFMEFKRVLFVPLERTCLPLFVAGLIALYRSSFFAGWSMSLLPEKQPRQRADSIRVDL